MQFIVDYGQLQQRRTVLDLVRNALLYIQTCPRAPRDRCIQSLYHVWLLFFLLFLALSILILLLNFVFLSRGFPKVLPYRRLCRVAARLQIFRVVMFKLLKVFVRAPVTPQNDLLHKVKLCQHRDQGVPLGCPSPVN